MYFWLHWIGPKGKDAEIEKELQIASEDPDGALVVLELPV